MMHSERSERRAWQREVAIGLGRQLTRDEAETVRVAWQAYSHSRGDHVGPWPATFVAQWRGDLGFNSERDLGDEEGWERDQA